MATTQRDHSSTRGDLCALACADAFRGDGAIMASGMAPLSRLGAQVAQATFEPNLVLTDGVANIDENGRSSTSGGAAYALAMAQKAADLGIKIFAVSVGVGADQDLMKQIASIGNGEHFHAEGSIEDYSAGLADIFSTIGVRRSVTLIE